MKGRGRNRTRQTTTTTQSSHSINEKEKDYFSSITKRASFEREAGGEIPNSSIVLTVSEEKSKRIDESNKES